MKVCVQQYRMKINVNSSEMSEKKDNRARDSSKERQKTKAKCGGTPEAKKLEKKFCQEICQGW